MRYVIPVLLGLRVKYLGNVKIPCLVPELLLYMSRERGLGLVTKGFPEEVANNVRPPGYRGVSKYKYTGRRKSLV